LRILMISDEFTISGASTAFFRLAVHLQARGHAIKLLPRNPEDGPIARRYVALGIPIIDTAKLAEFDLVVATTIAAAAFILQVPAGLPVIWLINEAEVGLKYLLNNNGLLPAFARASAVIYNTPFQHDVYRSFTYHLDPGKFHAAPYGVDIDPAIIARTTISAKRAKMRVVQVGTIEPRKRPGDLIRAVALSGLDIECVICGKFYELDQTAQNIVAKQPEKYRILEGLTDGEVLGWVESADMFCLASDSETQSLAAYEAALLARPLLLSDLPCYRDIFAHGRNCLMFPPGHIDLLARSIGMYFGNPKLRADMGQAAQQTAQRYNNATYFARFDAIMSSVAERSV
jgi:glycosyltransferase involved in cell wall biosynthesis